MDAVGNANAVGAALPFSCGETRGGFGAGKDEKRQDTPAQTAHGFILSKCLLHLLLDGLGDYLARSVGVKG